jgi:hypothetical protein
MSELAVKTGLRDRLKISTELAPCKINRSIESYLGPFKVVDCLEYHFARPYMVSVSRRLRRFAGIAACHLIQQLGRRRRRRRRQLRDLLLYVVGKTGWLGLVLGGASGSDEGSGTVLNVNTIACIDSSIASEILHLLYL